MWWAAPCHIRGLAFLRQMLTCQWAAGGRARVVADIASKSTVEPRCNVDKLTICKQGPASVVFTHRAQTLSWGIYSQAHRRNTTVKQHSAIKFLSPLSQQPPGPPPSTHSMCGPMISILFCFASVGVRISKYHKDKAEGGTKSDSSFRVT